MGDATWQRHSHRIIFDRIGRIGASPDGPPLNRRFGSESKSMDPLTGSSCFFLVLARRLLSSCADTSPSSEAPLSAFYCGFYSMFGPSYLVIMVGDPYGVSILFYRVLLGLSRNGIEWFQLKFYRVGARYNR